MVGNPELPVIGFSLCPGGTLLELEAIDPPATLFFPDIIAFVLLVVLLLFAVVDAVERLLLSSENRTPREALLPLCDKLICYKYINVVM
jgi:hypothetical protein